MSDVAPVMFAAICVDFVKEAAQSSDGEFICDVLHIFSQSNRLRLVVDKDNEVLRRYQTASSAKKNSQIVASWLKLLSKRSHHVIEKVNVKIRKDMDSKAAVVEIVSKLASSRNIIAWSSEDYSSFSCNSKGITVVDRGESIAWCSKFLAGNPVLPNEETPEERKRVMPTDEKQSITISHSFNSTSKSNNNDSFNSTNLSNGITAQLIAELSNVLQLAEETGSEEVIERAAMLKTELVKSKPSFAIARGVWEQLLVDIPRLATAGKAMKEIGGMLGLG